MRATIDGVEVYMDDGQLPAFSLSVNSLTDPSVVKGATSTTIRVIATKEARRVLGGEGMAEVPRNGRPVLRIGDDSVDLFVSEMRVLEQNRDQIQCVAVSGNASWFDYAKRTKMNEINWGLGLTLSVTNLAAGWALPDERLDYWPLVDYGEHETATEISLEQFRPGARIWNALVQAMEKGGYRLVAKGKRAVRELPHFISLEDGSKTLTKNFLTNLDIFDPVSLQYDYVLDGEEPTPLPFDDLTPSAPTGWNVAGTYKYTTQIEGNLYVSFDADLVAADSDYIGKRFRVVLWDETDGVTLGFYDGPEMTDAPGPCTFSGEFVAYVPEGHVVYMGITINGVVTTPDLTNGSMSARWDQEGPVTEFYSPLVPASIMPKDSIAKVLQDLMTVRSYVPITKGKTIEIWAHEEYFRKPYKGGTYRDWSDRMDHSEAPAKVLEELPANINAEYAPDEKDWNLNRLDRISSGNFANARIKIPAGFGPDVTTKVRWAPSFMGTRFDGCFIPIIKPRDPETETSYEHAPRLLYADGTLPGEFTIEYAGLTSDRTQYPNCYFLRPSDKEQVAMAFDNPTIFGGQQPTIVEGPWASKLAQITGSRMLECDLFLRDHELQDFDHGMPTLVDDGSGPAWYWVQEIQQHRLGKGIPTKCILVEIPGKEVALKPYVEPEPFVCDGPGYVSITFTGNIDLEYSAGYFSYRRASDGSVHTADGVEVELTGPDTICIWRSHANGTPVEDSRAAFAVYGGDGDITAIEMSGLAAVPFGAYGSLQLLNTSIPEITIPAIAGQEELYIIGSTESIILPSTHALIHIVITCRLTVGSVNAILANLRANEFSGECDLSGGTNAAPTVQGIADVSWLIGNGATIYTN